jgi:hypothetical protein
LRGRRRCPIRDSNQMGAQSITNPIMGIIRKV